MWSGHPTHDMSFSKFDLGNPKSKPYSSKSHSGSNILSTHIPFIPCQSTFPFLGYGYFKIWYKISSSSSQLSQSEREVQTFYQVHSISLQVNQRSHSWGTAISKFDLEKFKGILTHIPHLLCQWALPFLIYGYFKIRPWNLRSRSWGRSKSHSGSNIQSTSFHHISIGSPISKIPSSL